MSSLDGAFKGNVDKVFKLKEVRVLLSCSLFLWLVVPLDKE